ncbi:KR domain-containing protein, partial [archaeon]
LAWLQSQAGVQVDILSYDVSREESVQAMLSEVRGRSAGGYIDGIIHTDGSLIELEAAGCEEVWNAKALSAWWLHKHSQCDDLLFFVCCSSMNAALGNIGQSAYGAANCFLGALMEERRRLNIAGSCLSMSPLFSALLESSKSFMVKEKKASSAHDEENAITDWMSFASMLTTYARLAFSRAFVKAADFKPSKPNGFGLDANALLTFDDEVSVVRSMVSMIVKDVLGFADCDTNKPLLDLGLDSISIVELEFRLAVIWGKDSDSIAIFSYPSISALARHIYNNLAGRNAQSPTIQTVYNIKGENHYEVSVAVIGAACQLPGDINNLHDLWQTLEQGKVHTCEAPLSRW